MAIRIVICKKVAFVWNPNDVRILREDHRIVGALVGAHPRAPYQNSQLSLPLKLMPEEVTLLRDKGLATLVNGEFRAETPSDQLLEEYAEYKKQQYEGQNAIFLRDQSELRRKFATKIAEGGEKRRQRAELKSGVTSADVDSGGGDTVVKPMAEEYTMVQLFHEEPWRPCQEPAEWLYPESDEEKLRYHVFTDLWERGFYLTSGGKFGGDFLVYPGDPLMYHSYHIAICLHGNHRLDARQLVSMGRLGSNVRKTVVICSISQSRTDRQGQGQGQGHDDEIVCPDSQVHYLTLEWTGIS